jgi:hypothetical protein
MVIPRTDLNICATTDATDLGMAETAESDGGSGGCLETPERPAVVPEAHEASLGHPSTWVRLSPYREVSSCQKFLYPATGVICPPASMTR